MKREVEREQKLPPFRIGIAELEVLFDRLLTLFPEPPKVHCSIDLSLESEKLQFDSVAELKQYKALKGKITKFTLWLSQGEKLISVRSSTLFGSRGTISAKAGNEAWCAGAVETVTSFLQSHRPSFHWLITYPLGWTLTAFAYIPGISIALLPKGTIIDKGIAYSWIAITVSLAILYFARSSLFPVSVLVISEEEGFLRRNAAVLGLLIALISVVLTAISLFADK